LPLWNWKSGGPVMGRPLPANQVIAFGSTDGKVYVSFANESSLLYRFATGGEIRGSLAPYGTRTLLVPSGDKSVYAIDLFTAEAKWNFPTGSPVEQEPLVADTDVYAVNKAGNLSALDAETGTPRWT